MVAGIHVEPKRQLLAADLAAADRRLALFRSAKQPLLRLYKMNSYTEDEPRARFEEALGVQPLQ